MRPSAQTLAQPNGTMLALPAGEWSYAYDALGHRALKERTSPSSVKTHYLYSPHGLLLGESNAGSTGLDTIYVRLEGTLVGIVRGNQVYAVHADQAGRPEVVTNGAKAVVWRASNLAFDRAVTVDAIGGLGVGFPGQVWDAELGTWHNVYREYDATTGRFLTTDPLGLGGGSNLYAYVGGNPVSYVDPLGLELCRAQVGSLDDYLDSDFAPVVQRWHALNLQSGINTPFSSAFRSTAEQGMLDDGNSNTPAPAGNSLHEAGFAVDVHWRTGLTPAQQTIVRDNAAAAGLSWGGNFRTPDPVHFYVDPGNRSQRIQDAQRRYHDGRADACTCH
jgi:RHS repeat-associated protein